MILLRYMFPVAEKKEDDSWQRNPGGVWMASQDKVGTDKRLGFIRLLPLITMDIPYFLHYR